MAGVDDLDVVLEQNHLALGEIVKGNAEPLKMLFSRGEDVTLANPFGPPVRGWKQAAETMERAATNYRDGEVVGFETVAKYVTSDIAYIVEVERFKAKVGGSQELAAISLRATTVFRAEDGAWKIVHRHADPITSARPAESVVQK